MTNVFSLNSSNYQLNKYIEEYKISIETKNKLNLVEILILPSLIEDSNYYFEQESINFIEYCRLNENEIKIDILSDNEKVKIFSLNPFEKWMPIIWISSEIILPFVISLVSNYIFDHIQSREKSDFKVKINFVINDGEKTKELHYDGDARTFKETFEKIDIHKM